MRKPIAFILAFLLVAPLFVAAAAGIAAARDLYTIPVNQSVQVSPNIKANLIQLTISDTTYGASFAEDQTRVIFPVLVYTYQNVGAVPDIGHLKVYFMDNQGQIREGVDAGTFDQVQPGKTTANRIIEINIPKDRKITQISVVNGPFSNVTIPIDYGVAVTPTQAPGPSGSTTASPGNMCLGSLILPLTLVGAAWAGIRLTRK